MKIKKILIYGAGEAGQMILDEINKMDNSKIEVIGFLDDDKKKHNKKIKNRIVFGGLNKISDVYNKYKFSEIIVAIPSAPYKNILNIIKTISVIPDIKIKIVPGTKEIIEGRVTWNQIKDIDIEELLGRNEIIVNNNDIYNYIKNKNILITGAGGSIGSEIARQCLKYSPKKIILLGRGENSIYEIYSDLLLKNNSLKKRLIPIILNITDYYALEDMFKKYKIDIVFHAAAHKHVPLMENNPKEAFKNNIIGSLNLFEISEKYNIKKLIAISTDKAVNPTSVMGATKKIMEILLEVYNKKGKIAKFLGVRFGNVLESRGSVIPFFKKQIENGGPVTVTHKDIVRFFMTIPEAVNLVLQAGSLEYNKGIFFLDMGEPIKIYNLAENLIKLYGLKPKKDIEIKITGLRPGEKLFEELTSKNEDIIPTKYKQIFIAKQNSSYNSSIIKKIKNIYKNLYNHSDKEIKKLIFDLINK